MRRFALKALFTLLTLSKDNDTRISWDRIVLVGSIIVTIGLIGFYAYGKLAGH